MKSQSLIRQSIRMTMKKMTQYAYRIAGILFCFMLLFVVKAYNLRQNGINVFSMPLVSLGGINIFADHDYSNLIFYLTPLVIMLYAFSDYFKTDFLISYTYVFSRYGKKQHWLKSNALSLLYCIAVLHLILIAVSMLVGWSFGLDLIRPGVAALIMIFEIWSLSTLGLFCMILLQNFMSLLLGTAVSFLISVFLLLVSILMPFYMPQFAYLWRFIPLINQSYVLHSDKILYTPGLPDTGEPVQNFPVLFSVSLISIYIAVIYGVAREILLKQDLGDTIREVE